MVTQPLYDCATHALTWGGGKSATKNWTLKAEATTPANINTLKTNNTVSVIYNLQGQRVQANYRGIIVKNGRKMFVK